jgi:hypothetical protein
VRIRQVKPGFWTDSTIAELPAPVRLFYIGLWMLADDGGYLRWDVPQIANELYGYESRRRRERDVNAFVAHLETAMRLIRFDCGHAYIPTLVEHQRMGGETKRVLTVTREHSTCPRLPADARDSPLIPTTVRNGRERVGNGKERNGTPRAGEPDGPRSEFEEKVPRLVALGDA